MVHRGEKGLQAQPTKALSGGPRLALGVLFLLVFCFHAASAQNVPRASNRMFVDPCLGHRWQLLPDAVHPGGLARMVQLAPIAHPEVGTLAATPIIIHPGDHVRVEQQTPLLQSNFTAVALESARAGASFRVRLLTGVNAEAGASGPVVTVVATAAGLARWPGRSGGQP